MASTPHRLSAIVASLHPWLRARISTITIWPLEAGGWIPMLSYVHPHHPAFGPAATLLCATVLPRLGAAAAF